MNQEILSEKTEQAAPLLPLTDDDHEYSDESEMIAESLTGRHTLHPAFYIAAWIALSSGVILFNKWILDSAKFRYPIFLTTWHLASSAVVTQIMARYTTYLDSRNTVPMTRRTYIRAIVPIGLLFSLSLVCGNMTYLYLSVSFVQMLKAGAPIAVLLATWAFRLDKPSVSAFGNISIIVLGVILASLGEIKFHVVGVAYQMFAIIFEAVRLVMIQRLLSAEFKMDPLVSLYYFAPVCAVANGVLTLIFEASKMTMDDFSRVGYFTLVLNAATAFFLNFSSLLLIGKTSSLVLTLSGVFKNIMIVFASILFFHDTVSGLQFIGFSVALGGLALYQLGGTSGLQKHLETARSRFSEYRKPLMTQNTVDSLEAQNLIQDTTPLPSPGFKSA